MAFEIKTVYRAPTPPEPKKQWKHHPIDVNAPLILEPDNFTDDEWETILKVFGMAHAEQIIIEDFTIWY